MQYRNTKTGYGLIARFLHWIMALAVFGLFALGYWMRTLDYYSPYYKTSVDLHQSIGLVLLVVLVFRFFWKISNPSPSNHDLSNLERYGSSATHWMLYLLLLVIMISGYFISTLDGRPISFFSLIDLPSLYTQKGLEKLAGQIHWILAYAAIALALLHAIAALWHHYVKGDQIMARMIKSPEKITPNRDEHS